MKLAFALYFFVRPASFQWIRECFSPLEHLLLSHQWHLIEIRHGLEGSEVDFELALLGTDFAFQRVEGL